MLKNKKILLGITGSVAAKKCLDLVQQLLQKQVSLKIILTKSAENFISKESLTQILGTDEVYLTSDLFSPNNDMLHISLARFPDIILVAPTSANFIAKLNAGFADDLLSSVCLASKSKLFIAPAMNQQMWHNSFTQSNLENIKKHDIAIIGPASGWQACGDFGYGRMFEPNQIIVELEQQITSSTILANKKVVITAGPTIEQIDTVRYISNFSSGKMGYAIAKAAMQLGAEVILISGPTNLAKPNGVEIQNVKSAAEMLDKVLDNVKGADIFISCAAVADYTPAIVYNQKLKKNNENLQLALKPTPDIVREVAKLKNKPFVVGMAAETNDLLANAHKKLIDKNLDMIIANDVSGGAVFGSDLNQISILTKHKQQIHIPLQSKENIAKIIWQHIISVIKYLA